MLSYNTKKETIQELTHPCKCKACHESCNFGSGALVGDDLIKLANFLNLSEKEVKEKYLEEHAKFNTTLLKPKLEKKPYGKCVFFDQVKGCTVHEAKPTECRIAMNCKNYGEELIIWFNLKHYLNPDDPESLRQYKLYLDSGGKTLPGAEINNFVDKDTLKKIMEYEDLKDDTDWEEVLGIKEE